VRVTMGDVVDVVVMDTEDCCGGGAAVTAGTGESVI
jgi:hypothetical protein